MKRTNGTSKVSLSGVFCLPTSSKAHINEPEKGTAFKSGQYMYLLRATQSPDEGGYPAQVVLTSDRPIVGLVKQSDGSFLEDEWTIDAEVATQHAEVRKNLPPRFVAAVRLPDGSFEGDISTAPKGMGLPHWEFINANDEGGAKLNEVQGVIDRIEANKKATKDAKDAVRAAKSGKPARANA